MTATFNVTLALAIHAAATAARQFGSRAWRFRVACWADKKLTRIEAAMA